MDNIEKMSKLYKTNKMDKNGQNDPQKRSKNPRMVYL